METKETSRPVVSTGSLFKSSEGILISVFTALCGNIIAGDYADMVQATAIASLGVAVAGYAIARAKGKA